MSNKSNTKKFFQYSNQLKEVNKMQTELKLAKVNLSNKHLWSIYNKIKDLEKENTSLPKLSTEIIKSGNTQTLYNLRDSSLLLEKIGNANKIVINILKNMRQLIIGEKEKDKLKKAILSLISEIKRISETTIYNNEINLLNGTSLLIQIGLDNSNESLLEVNFPELTISNLELEGINIDQNIDGLLLIIDKAIKKEEYFESNNNIYLNRLKLAKETTKIKLETQINQIESHLMKLALYYKELSINYYSKSTKKDIPHILQ